MGKTKGQILLCEGALLLVAVIWGSGFMATRIAVDARLSASFILMGRFTVAAVVFGAVFFGRLRASLSRRTLLGGALIGAALFLGFITQTLAMERTTPSNAGFLTATNVVMVPFLWWAAARKRPPARMIAACALCLCGIGALSLRWGEALRFSPGDALALLCSFFFAVHIVLTGVLSARMDTAPLVFVQFATAAALSAAFFFLFDRDLSAFQPSAGLMAVGYLGLFSTCLCFFLQTVAQTRVPASHAALLLCTESLFCTVFSVLMGYEPVTGNMLAGGGIILASVVLSEAPGRSKAPVDAAESR